MKADFQLTHTKSLILILIAGYFAFLFNLQHPVVREWDEATYGINAYEMSVSNNPLVVTFNGQSDVYNSKPPLGVWLMSIATKIFGVNTFSLRISSALICLLFCFFLFEFIYRKSGNLYWALYAVLVLMGSIGFTGWHEARSGDFDAIVACFISVYVLIFISSVQEENPRNFLWAGVFLLLACLTKGVYGLVALPGLFIFLLLQKRLKWTLSQWQFYAAMIGFWAFFSGYYFWREKLSPGYIHEVLKNEVGERIFLETHIHQTEIPFYYHTFKLLVYRFQPFVLLFPFVLLKLRSEPKGRDRNFSIGLLLTILGIWTVISFSKTKLVWYDGSLYPLLAIVTGWFLSVQNVKWKRGVLAFLLLINGFVCYLNVTENDSFSFPHFLQWVRNDNNEKSKIWVYSKSFEHPIRYYLLQDSLEGNSSSFTNNVNNFRAGDLILFRNSEAKQELDSLYLTQLVYTDRTNQLVKVTGLY